MKVREEDLRRAFQRSTARIRVEDCLSPEELGRVSRGGLRFWERNKIAEHLSRCSDCAQECLVGWEIGAWAEDRAGGGAVLATPRVPRLLLAVAAAVIVGVGLSQVPWRRSAPPALRGGDRQGLVSLLEGRHLDRDHLRLRWSGAPEGSRYSVTVLTPQLTIVFRRNNLTRPEVDVPAANLASVPPGDLHWVVDATTPDGGRLSSSSFVNRLD
jgi:hypothetical protein